MTRYCPHCWSEVAAGTVICPQCQLHVACSENYLAKLIRALHHPEAFTRRRAACILGLLRRPEAIDGLAAVLACEADPYVRGEAAHAVGCIGGVRAHVLLLQIVQDALQPVIVRRAAGEALLLVLPPQEDDRNG
jgi:HEAT repeat protein